MKQYVFILFFACISLPLIAQDLHYRNKDLPCLNKKFNLHFHVAQDSLGRTNISRTDIDLVLINVNKYFSPICVSFDICAWEEFKNYNFDSIGSDTKTGEVVSHYNVSNRINVYVAQFLDEPWKCGFASLGGVANLDGKQVFLDKDCPGSLAHELGHFFGLHHTFEGRDELADGSNCLVAGDTLCDTPADPYIEGAPVANYVMDCKFIFPGRDMRGNYYIPDVGNIMSYYGCDCGFTREQYLKMVATYSKSKRKLW